MAFSTQKDFMEVGFMNTQMEPICAGRNSIKLKTYTNTTDPRSWSLDNKDQSNFLADLVSCRTFVPAECAKKACEKANACKNGDRGGNAGSVGNADSVGNAGSVDSLGESNDVDGSSGRIDDEEQNALQHSKDSLLEEANEKLQNLIKIVGENEKLKSELCMTQEKAKIINKENTKIKKILDQDLEDGPLYKKIKELRNQEKINENDEKELLEIQRLTCTKDKAVNILEAENDSLRRIIEKLSQRTASLKLEELETSTDVQYLQNKVNELKKEVMRLNNLEKEREKVHGELKDMMKNSSSSKNHSNVDKAAFDMIVTERNKLRNQLTQMFSLEEKIQILKQRALEAEALRKALKKLEAKFECLESENQSLKCKLAQLCEEARNCKSTLLENECLKQENDKLKGCLCEYECKCEFMEALEQKLLVTECKLRREQQVIRDYECQFHQLMTVIEELEGNPTDAQRDEDGHVKDLSLAIKAALEQIKIELSARGSIQCDLNTLKNETENENTKLRSEIDGLLKTLKACQAENEQYKASLSKLTTKILPSSSASSSEPPLQNLTNNCCEQLACERKMFAEERAELQKRIKQCEELKDRVEEGDDKSKMYRDKSKSLSNEKLCLESQINDLTVKLKGCQDALDKQKRGILDQNDLLGASKSELEQRNQRIKDLESSNKCLKDANDTLNCKLKEMCDKLSNLENNLEKGLDTKQYLEKALEQLREEFCNCSGELGAKEQALKDAQKSIKALRDKNATLEKENEKSKDELNETAKLLAQIEKEREKNKELQYLLSNFEEKLKNIPKPVECKTDDLQKSIRKLRCKLSNEEKKNAYLTDQLRMMEKVPAAEEVKKQMQTIERQKTESLTKLQKIHSVQIKSIQEKPDINLDDITDILKEIKQCVCRPRTTITYQSKMQRICQKISEEGIESLNVKELTHLHGEVYKAGIRLKPELLKKCDGNQRCCKCTEFSCCLPPISKDTEKRMIARIIFLENEVDKANKILTHLKQKHYKELSNFSLDNDLTDLVTGKTVKRDICNLPHYAGTNAVPRRTKSARPLKRAIFECPTRD